MAVDKKVVIVTGGGSGIGGATSRAFVSLGHKVIIGQRSTADIDGADSLSVDLSGPDQCAMLIDQAIERYGRLDVLVNNAGMMSESSVEDTSIELWDRTMAINLRAPFILTKLAIPHLRKTRGAIVNVGSIEGLGSNPNHSAYCASKAGLHALTRATAVDHGAEVRCNAVAPGWIDTELNEAFIEGMPDPDNFREKIGGIHPVGRTGSADDVAGLICFLASKEATFISGQTFTIDGGRTIQLSLPN